MSALLAPQAEPIATPSLTGLSSRDAQARLQQYGSNELAPARRASALRELGRSLASPLMLILIAASIVAASVGEVADAMIIVVTVLLGATLDAVQTARSTSAVERLRHSVVPTATVHRDGEWREIARRDVVPGDLIRLSAGDVVPADALLVSTRDLHVQQAALTGESVPAEKEAASEATGAPPTDPNDGGAVFLGTSVASGSGVARVLATGPRTAFGTIAARLREAPPPTELDRGMQCFGVLLARTVAFLVLFLVLVSVGMRRDPLESLLFAVALAVGLVPEFMPMVTSMTLATGAVRMARKHVIVKHLAAIHNFGSVDVLCSDKTGTLTKGEMELVAASDSAGRADSRVLALAATAAHLETGIRNPLDDAIRRASPLAPGWTAMGELPFDFERRRMAVIARRGDECLLITKGALEGVLGACVSVRSGPGVLPLDDTRRREIGTRVEANGAAGLRTIVVATRSLDVRDGYTRADEHDLTLEGWLTFADPPLPDAAATIRDLEKDGVRLKILTGDDAPVARHVCAATGIDASSVVLGPDLEHVSDAALGALAERTTLFARVTPQQKLRVLLALKGRGHVVGYLGDGINDAPALHAADVGISVGNAVDVAKDAADIILLDRGLDVLHSGILEGRKAFGNVMKYLLMSTSSNFGNMFSMAVASMLVPFLPMLPTQILLTNFLYDVAQIGIPSDRVDDAYIQKPHRWDMSLLRRFMVRVGLVSSVFDMATFAVLLLFFRSSAAGFRTGWFIESLATQTLVLFVIRTTGNPLRNHPSRLFAGVALVTLVAGLCMPWTPFGALFGFVRLPLAFLAIAAVMTAAYLAAVEVAKRRLVPQLLR